MYPFQNIEPKWQKFWDEHKTFKAVEDESFPKEKRRYILDMFPYPSGAGLHVGHPEGYTATDIYSRFLRMNGFNVLHPMGYDAFGLPAENYAIKTGTHPAETTFKNIAHFTEQIKALGFSYDWDREIKTCTPDYYKWTQWIFLQLYKKGLAYEAQTPINWCPSCMTGLANEEVKEGHCDRCGAQVTHKVIRQWILKITAYADRLLKDLDELDWPESVKAMQRNWIGRSVGAEVDFAVADKDGKATDQKLTVYTTRCDTLFGATYMVVSPEHPLIEKLTTAEQKEAVEKYRDEAAKKSDLERTDLAKTKTGVFSGSYAINPVNGKLIPIWVADYVLISYGTGAIMAVPAHDTRDWDFAKKFGLPIIEVLKSEVDVQKEAWTQDGIHVNSEFLDGLNKKDAIAKMLDFLEEKKIGHKAVNYKLRDWVFSRQRYWGEPIPLVHCPKCGTVPVPETELPLELPNVKTYQPTGTGESPLAGIESWVNCKCPNCGADSKRETNTMPQWAGSSWYFLRYVDNKNDKELVSKEKADKYLPVDMYIGGVEHAVLHLLYSRFYTKFLYDQGVIDFDEPFKKLFNQGMITGKNGVKMSKSMGNVVSPDDLIEDYGCDALRLYELFVGPPEMDAEWDDRGIDGVRRFLNRFWNLVTESADKNITATSEMIKIRHRITCDITSRIESFSLNTVVSGFMEYTNKLIDIAKKEGGIDKETLETVVTLLAPFAPHISEELWEQLGHKESVFVNNPWPEYDEAEMKDDTIEIAVQVNGKMKGKVTIPADANQETALAAAKEALGDKYPENVVKEIYVPGRIINVVAR